MQKDLTRIYILKGVIYLEKPDRCYTVKEEVLNDKNVIKVYVKRRRFIYEWICVLLLCLSLCTTIFIPEFKSTVHIPDRVNYYDGKLFINIVNDETSFLPVEYTILNSTGILEPGDQLYYINTDTVDDTVTVLIKTKSHFIRHSESYAVNVIKTF